MFASAFGGAWVAVFLVFLLLIKRKYCKTFVSFQSGNDYVQNFFLKKQNTDERRASIVKKSGRLWQSIRPQVCEWLKENWPRWVEEKPEWFTPVFISKVDDDLLPPEVLVQQNQMAGCSRRRSSIAEMMGANAQVVPVQL